MPYDVGNYGACWSSGINGMSLNFHVTWLSHSRAYDRAFGFQLRCLSE